MLLHNESKSSAKHNPDLGFQVKPLVDFREATWCRIVSRGKEEISFRFCATMSKCLMRVWCGTPMWNPDVEPRCGTPMPPANETNCAQRFNLWSSYIFMFYLFWNFQAAEEAAGSLTTWIINIHFQHRRGVKWRADKLVKNLHLCPMTCQRMWLWGKTITETVFCFSY